ncbi:hypothetical protein ABT144_21135 [Streptomyces sp. NPDC002039]|uniref:hypothetical protein n=1 Tax=Streptomyces sp. NPDC002039 TaxID=3154660 RepID=UPI0033253CDE
MSPTTDVFESPNTNLATNPTLEQVRGRRGSHSNADLEQWRTRIAAPESIDDTYALVSEYVRHEMLSSCFHYSEGHLLFAVDHLVQRT